MTIDRDLVLVNHILDAIDAIEDFVKDITIVEFSENDLIKSAVVKKFEVIGEASNKLSTEFKSEHSEITWRDIIGMRNILIHDYVGIDYEGVWNTIELYVPALKDALEKYRFSEEEKRNL